MKIFYVFLVLWVASDKKFLGEPVEAMEAPAGGPGGPGGPGQRIYGLGGD